MALVTEKYQKCFHWEISGSMDKFDNGGAG